MQLSRYATRWFTLALLGGTVSACAYIIPPSPNEPRNNTVQGDMHKPINNPMNAPQSSLTPREEPVKEVALPPVDNAMQQRAEALGAPVTAENLARHMPVENVQFQVSSNGYPAINSVPLMPVTTGPDSAQAHLNATKAELEVDRSSAITVTDTLAKDAAAEPSMLSELPKVDGMVPASDPINVAPADIRRIPANNPVPQSAVTPVAADVRSMASVEKKSVEVPVEQPVVVSSLPNIPAFAPPAPLAGKAAAPVVAAVSAPEPVGVVAALAPVVAAVTPEPTSTVIASASPTSFKVDLTPSDPAAISVKPLAAPVVAANAPNVRAGDFNPLTMTDNVPAVTTTTSSRIILSSSYASNRYIPPSRYSAIRN